MIISIASGKGGTGKTTIAVNLALSLNQQIQFLDCDVEEPNAHIFLKPKIENSESVTIPIPQVDKSKCDFCGKCANVCAYNAIAVLKEEVLIFEHLCHGCGGCSFFCPKNAITEIEREIGVIEYGSAGNIMFMQGRLNIGEAMPTPIIRKMKKKIKKSEENLTIIDVPPGTSCPVIESVKGSDFCILVTEPTPFGLNDLVLAVEVLKKLKIPFGVVINRADLGNDKTEEYCRQENIPILMKIPFKKELAMAYSKGEPMVRAFPEYREDFQNLFNTIRNGKFS
ncbi:MAG: ATP-binding protein [Candidatus Aenigmatarchaeota archaeon]